MHWKLIYEKLKMGQLWSLYGVTLISAYTLPLLEISLIVISFLQILVFVDSYSIFKPDFRYMIRSQCKEFVNLTYPAILWVFCQFCNFPIESLIKKTMIWGNFDQFSNLLNFQLICMKCRYRVKYKPNGYQSLRNNHTNQI